MRRMLFILVFVPVLSISQSKLPMSDSGKISFVDVYKVNLTKSELFSKSLEFAALYLKSANDEIQLKDSDRGKIIIKTSETIKYSMGKGILSETIIIDVKDNKCRINITNFVFVHENYPTRIIVGEKYPKSWFGRKSFYKALQNTGENIISDYHNHLEKKDDW